MNNIRENDAPVKDLFIDRWSPRSFDNDFELSSREFASLFEAARWSPSCFNEQPWTFLVARKSDKHFEEFLGLLNDFNQKWAKDSSLIGFIVSKKDFDKTGELNKHAHFDCGAAWMSLTLQARDLDLYTHGIGGVDYDKAYEKLNIPSETHDLICAFAVGKNASAGIWDLFWYPRTSVLVHASLSTGAWGRMAIIMSR